MKYCQPEETEVDTAKISHHIMEMRKKTAIVWHGCIIRDAISTIGNSGLISMRMMGGRYFHPETEKLILKFLNAIASYGLEEFHRIAQSVYTKVDYEGDYLP